jgi:transketolase
MSIENLVAKYQACGWWVSSCNGYDMDELTAVLGVTPFEKGKPSFLIAHPIWGKGVSFMENKAAWHHKVPNAEELAQSMEELNLKLENKIHGKYSL